ncbi:hypothetical protein [Rhodococcus sp. AD45]|uniref:hypothetical protein n=1 Tax=Rhodococcus sp. (strain AD45) TaxID=103808 RepID=UPI0005DDBF88|nr:hypothetical protein [Rhodococcus sp. AD45]KJF19186.1 hypothetical protein SZ00_06113 [Rhodococcus sp. AD45]
MTVDPLTLAELSSRDRIEALRRRMASIPARTDGAAVQAEARFEIRQEAAHESSVERPRGSPGDRQTAPERWPRPRFRRLCVRSIIGAAQLARFGDRQR